MHDRGPLLLLAAVLTTMTAGPQSVSADAPSNDSPAAAATAATPPESTAAPNTVPLKVASNGKFCVDAMIDGKGPYSLMIDSGSETMMLKPSVAEACGLTVKTGTVEVRGPTGGFVPVGQADIETVIIAGLTISHPICTVQPSQIPYDGMIGAPLLNAGVVRMDMPGKLLTVYAPGMAFTPNPADVVLPIVFGNQRVPEVMGSIGGMPAKLEVDTGSSFPAELQPSFVKANDLASGKFAKIGQVGHTSVSGPVVSDVYDLQTASLGDKDAVQLPGPIPTLFLGEAGPSAVRDFDGRIGCPLLTSLVLTFDYASAKLYVKSASSAVPSAAPPETPTPTPATPATSETPSSTP